MKESNNVIPIFFTIDDSYAPLLGVALSSILENASKSHSYHIIVIYEGLSPQNKERLSSLQTENSQIQFVEMEDKLGMITDQMSSRLRADYFTLTIYFRLFIPSMFPQYDKGIYLDSDIVVPGDISELYQTELGDNLLGAAIDPVIANIPQLSRHAELCVGVDKKIYFNSGVLLMNLKKLREVQIDRRFLELYSKYHFDTVAPDQDYLNAMCSKKVSCLPAAWDAMPSDMGEPIAHPKLVHYNLFAKPWYYDKIQYEEYFWHFARNSSFYSDILAIKEGYTDEQKQADEEHMALLISRANETGNGAVTFRTVFQEGQEARL